MVAFFIVIICLVPGYFYSELFKEEKDIGGVSTLNRAIFYDLIDERMSGKNLPGILGQGEEFVKMKVRNKEEFELMSKIKQHPNVVAAMPTKVEGREAIQVKPICLLMAYMSGMINRQTLT